MSSLRSEIGRITDRSWPSRSAISEAPVRVRGGAFDDLFEIFGREIVRRTNVGGAVGVEHHGVARREIGRDRVGDRGREESEQRAGSARRSARGTPGRLTIGSGCPPAVTSKRNPSSSAASVQKSAVQNVVTSRAQDRVVELAPTRWRASRLATRRRGSCAGRAPSSTRRRGRCRTRRRSRPRSDRRPRTRRRSRRPPRCLRRPPSSERRCRGSQCREGCRAAGWPGAWSRSFADARTGECSRASTRSGRRPPRRARGRRLVYDRLAFEFTNCIAPRPGRASTSGTAIDAAQRE